eukprot:gene31907-41398_t
MKAFKRKIFSGSKNDWDAPTSPSSASGSLKFGDDLESGDSLSRSMSDNEELGFGLSAAEAAVLLKIHGRNELPTKIIPKWYIFLSLLWEPMPVMIWIAIGIEAALGKWMDMSILLAIQMANASIAFYETTKSGDAVAALKASLRPEATVKRDGIWRSIDAALLVPGDLVLLSTGSAVPADCKVFEGSVEIDQSSLTGESIPITVFKGESCKMGSTVARGEVDALVLATGANTFFGRTASLLQNDGELSNLQNILMDIMIVLVVISLTLCAVVYLHLAHITSVVEALSFTVVLMVASIPLAIEIVTTTTLALGSKELSKHGRLAECPVYHKGETQYSLLRYAAMATKWKEPPKDALDTLTLSAADIASLATIEQLHHMPFDPVVKRTESTIRDRVTGQIYKTTKGAPHVIIRLIAANYHTHSSHAVDTVPAISGIANLEESNGTHNSDSIYSDKSRAGLIAETCRRLDLGSHIMAADVLPSLDVNTRQKPPNLARDYGNMILEADGDTITVLTMYV